MTSYLTPDRAPQVRARLSQADFTDFLKDLRSGPTTVPAWRDTEDLLKRTRIRYSSAEIIDRTEEEVVFAL
jgi:hypothetical protein